MTLELQGKELRAIIINLRDAMDALRAGMKEGAAGRLPVMHLNADLARGVIEDMRARLEKGEEECPSVTPVAWNW